MRPDNVDGATSQTSSSIGDALRDRWFLGLLASGLVVRVALAVLTEDRSHQNGDEVVYAREAATLLLTGKLETGFFERPPLYFLFMAAVQFLFEQYRLAATILQSVAGAAAAIPVYRTACRIAGRRSGRLAAAFLLFDPTLIAYCSSLWPETLFLLLVSIIFDGIGRLPSDSRWQAVGLGIVTGIAMLLKPVFALFTLLVAGWWIVRLGLRRMLRLSLVFGGAAALVIAPWVIRNQVRYGPAIILENQGPYNLWLGNDPRPSLIVLREWIALGDPVIRSRVGLERGLAAIRKDVGGFLQHSAVRALNLWGLEFFIVRNVIFGSFGPVTKETLLVVFWIVQVGYVLLMISCAAGLGPTIRDPAMRLVLIYALVFTLLVCTMVVTTRFRVQFGFLLSVAAGIGASRVAEGRITMRSLALVAGAMIVLALSASRPVFQKIGAARFESVTELRNSDWFFNRY